MAAEDQFETGDMKCGVDLHGAGELYMIRHRAYPFDNLKWANVMGSQFFRFYPQWKIFHGQPHPLARVECGGHAPLAVC